MKKYFYFVVYNSRQTRSANCNVELEYEITSIEDIVAIEKSIADSNHMSEVVVTGYQLLRIEG